MDKYDKSTIERMARMYKSCTVAGKAIGITGATFIKICRKFGIRPPLSGRWKNVEKSVE